MPLTLPDITIHEPEKIRDACTLLKRFGNKACIIAGGTDVVVNLKERLIKGVHLVSIKGIKHLQKIKKDGMSLSIGTLATANDIAENRLVKKHLPALADAALSMASFQIRNMATIGGNLESAVPSADMPPILLAADARIVLCSGNKKRRVKITEFFKGLRKTATKADEILTHVIIPAQPDKTGSAYHKFSLRGATALAVVGVAARVTLKQEKIANARIVLGAVAPKPIFANKAMAILKGEKPGKELFEEAGQIAAKEAKPISDIRGSAEYRRELVAVLTARALEDAVKRARGKKI